MASSSLRERPHLRLWIVFGVSWLSATACARTQAHRATSQPLAGVNTAARNAAAATPRFRIDLSVALAAPAPLVFRHLHAPEALRWLGRFELVRRSGDPLMPSGLGSTRRVTMVVPLVEETITAFVPPHTLEYSVTYSRAYARHHATMRLAPLEGETTCLRWIVTFDSLRRRPESHARFTEWYLRRALRRLQRVLRREASRKTSRKTSGGPANGRARVNRPTHGGRCASVW